MDPRHYLFADSRLSGYCVFCGESPNTRDHVPSRAFLDDPLPNNLPVVDACKACNQSFSSDEEYLSCFLDVVLSGTTDPDKLTREKVRRALLQNEKLASRIAASRKQDAHGRLIWNPEMERVQNVVVKLAKGHSAYELSLPQLEAPSVLFIVPFENMGSSVRADFERAGAGELREWPEIGSRAFLRACSAEPYGDTNGPWIVVQPGRYRYSVDQASTVVVRLVISEYLACHIEWE